MSWLAGPRSESRATQWGWTASCRHAPSSWAARTGRIGPHAAVIDQAPSPSTVFQPRGIRIRSCHSTPPILVDLSATLPELSTSVKHKSPSPAPSSSICLHLFVLFCRRIPHIYPRPHPIAVSDGHEQQSVKIASLLASAAAGRSKHAHSPASSPRKARRERVRRHEAQRFYGRHHARRRQSDQKRA